MPSTVLVMDQPCIGVDASNPGAMRSTSKRPLCTMAMPRALAASVRTFATASAREAVGVNTPDDLRVLEAYLRGRT